MLLSWSLFGNYTFWMQYVIFQINFARLFVRIKIYLVFLKHTSTLKRQPFANSSTQLSVFYLFSSRPNLFTLYSLRAQMYLWTYRESLGQEHLSPRQAIQSMNLCLALANCSKLEICLSWRENSAELSNVKVCKFLHSLVCLMGRRESSAL